MPKQARAVRGRASPCLGRNPRPVPGHWLAAPYFKTTQFQSSRLAAEHLSRGGAGGVTHWMAFIRRSGVWGPEPKVDPEGKPPWTDAEGNRPWIVSGWGLVPSAILPEDETEEDRILREYDPPPSPPPTTVPFNLRQQLERGALSAWCCDRLLHQISLREPHLG